MECLNCGLPTDVVNSRHQKRLNQVWRRRHCERCNSTVTTLEITDYSKALLVGSGEQKRLEPFLRDKLFLSLHRSLGHRKTATEDATALTATIIGRLLPHYDDPIVDTAELKKIVADVLKKFDRAAATAYLAYHPINK